MEPQTLDELLAWKPIYPQAVLGDGLLYAQCKLILYGKPESYKSMLVSHLGLSLSSGKEWLGFATPPEGVSVFYFQLEIPHPLLQLRVDGLQRSLQPYKQDMWFWTEHYMKLDLPPGLAAIERVIGSRRPQVLIIDPIYKVISGKIVDPTQVAVFLDYVDLLIEKYETSVVLVAHTRKGVIGESSDGEDLMGSTFLPWADTVIRVVAARNTGRREVLRLQFEKVRHATDRLPDREVIFNKDAMTFTYVPEQLTKPHLVTKQGG